jgi:hypothetical protein
MSFKKISTGNSNSVEIVFAAMNFKNIKDDYSEKFADILEKVQSGFTNISQSIIVF